MTRGTTALRVAIPMLALLLAACDEARDEYSYTLPSPPPTMPPPAAQQAAPPAGAVPETSSAQALPPAEEYDFSSASFAPDEPTIEVVLAGLALRLPAAWRDSSSGRPMRLAEYAVPGAGGAAELVVFHFGPGQGGSAAENAVRWLGQVAPDEDSEPQEFLAGRLGALQLTAVGASGTYTGAAMGGAQPASLPGHALLGLIVEGGPEGSLFLRMTGPRATVREEARRFFAMAASITPAGRMPSEQSSSAAGAQELPVAGLRFDVPAEWKSLGASGPMRAAQLEIPTDGEPIEVVFFHFGPGQGGSADANIQRWLGQMALDESFEPVTSRAEAGSLVLSEVVAEGDWSGGMAPGGAPATPRRGVRLQGFVIEGGPEGSVFVRAVGPRDAMRANEDALRALVQSAAR